MFDQVMAAHKEKLGLNIGGEEMTKRLAGLKERKVHINTPEFLGAHTHFFIWKFHTCEGSE